MAMKKGIKWKRIGRVVESWKHLFIRYFDLSSYATVEAWIEILDQSTMYGW